VTRGLYIFGRWVATHKILIAAGIGAWSKSLDATLNDDYSLPGTQSQEAEEGLVKFFPEATGPSATVVFVSTSGSITDDADQKYVEGVLKDVAELDGVISVSKPFEKTDGITPNISSDGTTALANVTYGPTTVATVVVTDAMTAALDKSASQAVSLNIEVTPGGGTYAATAGSGSGDSLSGSLGLIATVIILLVAFGSVIAMGLPLFSALAGLGVGISLTYVLAAWADISSIGPTIAIMIGLGVGIDYSLFIVTRYREFLRSGYDVPEAVGRAVGTAGQAVIVAGTTVIIALMGLLLIRIPIMSSIAYAAAIAVLTAIVTSITLLPALLGLFGRSVERINVHHLFGRSGTSDKMAHGWGKSITTHPYRWGTVALVAFAALIVPVLSIDIGSPGENSIPKDNPQRISYDIVSEKFTVGLNDPLLLLSTLPAATDEKTNEASIAAVGTAIGKASGVVAVVPPTFNSDKTAALWAVIPSTSASDPATATLISDLRDNVIPEATGSSGIETYVGGQTATFIDMADLIRDRMPMFMAAVIGLAFLLLLVVFRSIFVPVLAALMILLTSGATFGVMVAIFQWGWLGPVIGLDGATGPLVSYVPIMVFAIIFGLSMDYMIFLVSRIKESQIESGDNSKAVVFGISKSARVIVAAGLIMFSVFASFDIQDNLVIKMFGTGLAVAIIIDVVLARMILVPAVMTIGGKYTWAFPRWLRWIPDLKFEDSSVFDDLAEPESTAIDAPTEAATAPEVEGSKELTSVR